MSSLKSSLMLSFSKVCSLLTLNILAFIVNNASDVKAESIGRDVKLAKGDDGWSMWSDWICSVTCGGGQGTRIRFCIQPGFGMCQGPQAEFNICNEKLCPDVLYTLSPETKFYADTYLKTSLNSFHTREGLSVKLPCNKDVYRTIAAEYPKSTLLWLKNGKQLAIDNSRIKMADFHVQISQLRSADSGVYICRVTFAPRASQVVQIATLAVESDNPNLVLAEGDPLILICNGAALSRLIPGLTQKWYLNNTLFRNFADSNPQKNDVMTITKVTFSMSGLWTCKISVADGSYSWITNIVKVQVVPAITAFDRIAKYKIWILGGSVLLLLLVGCTLLYFRLSKTAEIKELEKEIKLLKVRPQKEQKILTNVRDEEVREQRTIKRVPDVTSVTRSVNAAKTVTRAETKRDPFVVKARKDLRRFPDSDFIRALDTRLRQKPPPLPFAFNDYAPKMKDEQTKLKRNSSVF